MLLEYHELQPANVVTAVTLGHITDSSKLQFVMFKKDLVEVWEVNDAQQSLIVAASTQFAAVDCALLEVPLQQFEMQEQCSPALRMCLDMLLIMDVEGRLCLLEWDGLLGLRESSSPLQVHKETSKVLQMNPNQFFSSPLLLPKDAAAAYYARNETIPDSQNRIKELQGITLVGFSLDTASLHVAVVEWTSSAKYANICAPKLIVLLDLLDTRQYRAAPICPDTVGHTSSFIVLSVAFIGAGINDTGSPESVLDMKGRPLIVILSTGHTGLFLTSTGCNLQALSIQCFALDLRGKELQQGPWKMRQGLLAAQDPHNLHPTTCFVLPWFYQDKEGLLEMGQAVEAPPVDCGMQPGRGVLLISSSSLMFIESTGRRSSVHISLKGVPTCYDASSNCCLPPERIHVCKIVGDSSGAMYIMDLSEWTNFQKQRIILDASVSPARIIKDLQPSTVNAEVKFNELHGGGTERVLYLGDTLGRSDLFLLRCNTGISTHFESEPCPLNMSPVMRKVASCNQDATGSSLLVGSPVISWTAEKLHVTFLESIAPVKDALCVRTRDFEGEQSLLAACGSSPNAATLKRGDLGVLFCLDIDLDFQINGLPLLLPFKIQWESQFDTHILLSYPQQNVSSVVAVDSSKASGVIIDALERRQCTLAIGMLPGGMLVQVTRIALIVLGVSGWRVFKAEWTPPTDKDGSVTKTNDMSHAALAADGAVLARGHMLFAVQLNSTGGIPHTTASSSRLHQVSALSVFDVGISANLRPSTLVILGLWISNSIVILSWPLLDDLSCISTDGGPIRSVSGALFRDHYFFCAGTADGYLLCYELPGKCEAVLRSNLDQNAGICMHGSVWATNTGQKLKVGESEVRLAFGAFGSCKAASGPQEGREHADCLLVQSTSFWAVILAEDSQYLHALPVQGLNFNCGSSARVHVADYPSTMVCLSTNGQLLFGHFDMSVSLRWNSISLPGCPRDLIYHSPSTCALVSCMEETGAWNLTIIQVPSMCQVLTLKLGSFHPVVLKVVDLPCLRSQDVIWKEYVLLICERANHVMGRLFLFNLSHSRNSEGEIQYKLRLVGQQTVELPCYSVCVVKSPKDFSFDMTQSQTEETYSPSVLHQDINRALIRQAQTEALLALGGHGKVQLLSIFVVHPDISISLLAALSGAVEAVLPFHDAQYNQCRKLEGDWSLEEEASREEVCENNEDVLQTYLHPTKSETCLLNLQHVTSFTTAGGGHVTELIPGCGASLTVVEYLRGVNIFQVGDQGKVVQLAWQPFTNPIQCLMPLSDNVFLVESQGISLFQRDREVEMQFQIEETQRDLERQSTSVNEHQPGDENQVQTMELTLEDNKADRMPGLERLVVATFATPPSAALRIFPGRLGLYAKSIGQTSSKEPGFEHAIIITRDGQVGQLKL